MFQVPVLVTLDLTILMWCIFDLCHRLLDGCVVSVMHNLVRSGSVYNPLPGLGVECGGMQCQNC